MTYAEAFTVQPFGNTLVDNDADGPADLDVLQQQWCNQTQARVCSRPRLMLPSATCASRVDRPTAAATCGDGTGVLASTAAPPCSTTAASYRIAVNNFMADGGDGYAVLPSAPTRSAARGPRRVGRYLGALPVAPPALNRINPKVG